MQITCGTFAAPLGDYITQVDLYLKDDASAPSSSTSMITDNWVGTGTTAFNLYITTASTDGINFGECYQSNGTGTQTGGACPIYEYISTPTDPTSFAAFNVDVSVSNVAGGGVAGNGNTTANLYVQYEYNSAAPEPATLGLMGGALLGFGLFARKISRR